MQDDAVALWGEGAVAAALAHPSPAPCTPRLRRELRRHATTDAALAAWGRKLPPARFAAVVRLVSGDTRADVLEAMRAADERKAS